MSELFDAGFFARLRKLKLATRIRLDRGQSGGRKSSAKGSSVEFSDFREYIPGDDIRRIDWNVYGRLNKLFIKQFMEEKEACYHLFLDSSASMRFGARSKAVMAQRLSAVFAWLVLNQLDRVELFTIQEGRLAKTSPLVGKGSFSRLLNDLEQVQFTGKTGLSEAIRKTPLHGRGICIIISDFLDPDGMEEAMRYLAFKRQEILLVQVLAREEVEFDAEGTLAIEDMETGEQVRVTMNRQALELYEATLLYHNQELVHLAKRYGAAVVSVISDEPLEKVVFETLKQKGIFG